MGYYSTSEPENAVPARSLVRPKTHTPFSQVQERGQRYYSPGVGRWVNRDPIGEKSAHTVLSRTKRVSLSGAINDYEASVAFVRNDPITFYDPIGLMASKPATTPTQCCENFDPKKTCDAICAEAGGIPKLRNGNSGTPSSGGVICYHGKKCACYWGHEGNKPGECPDIDATVKAHETKHFTDINEKQCKQCEMTRPQFAESGDNDASECKHRAESYKDLMEKATKAGQPCQTRMIFIAWGLADWLDDHCPGWDKDTDKPK